MLPAGDHSGYYVFSSASVWVTSGMLWTETNKSIWPFKCRSWFKHILLTVENSRETRLTPLASADNVQSGKKKKNLVAKIWATNFGDHLRIGYQNWYPTLVLSFTTWLTKGSLLRGPLVKWLPIKVSHICKLDTIWVVHCLPVGNGSIQLLITFNTLCLVEFYIQWCAALQWTHWHS